MLAKQFVVFLSITAKFQLSHFFLKMSGVVVYYQKVGLSYMMMIFLVLSTNTFECVSHTFTVITPENIGSCPPIAKWRENGNVLFFKFQQTGLKRVMNVYCTAGEKMAVLNSLSL